MIALAVRTSDGFWRSFSGICPIDARCGAPIPEDYLRNNFFIFNMVGAGRFERPTPCAQGRCATRLRYAPTFYSSDSKLLFGSPQCVEFSSSSSSPICRHSAGCEFQETPYSPSLRSCWWRSSLPAAPIQGGVRKNRFRMPFASHLVIRPGKRECGFPAGPSALSLSLLFQSRPVYDLNVPVLELNKPLCAEAREIPRDYFSDRSKARREFLMGHREIEGFGNRSF
jgi:hypothetical protein